MLLGGAELKKPVLAVIVPAYNAEGTLARCLEAILSSEFAKGFADNLECIVVDDGSSDSTSAIAQKYQTRVLSTGGRSGPARARNLGARATSGDVLVFIDADVTVHSD